MWARLWFWHSLSILWAWDFAVNSRKVYFLDVVFHVKPWFALFFSPAASTKIHSYDSTKLGWQFVNLWILAEKKNPSIFTSPRPGQMNSKGPSKSLPFSATASLEPSVTESMPPSQVTSAVPSPTGQRHVQIEDIPDKEPEVEKPKKPGTIAVSWLFLRNHFLTRNNLRMRFFKQWNSFEIDLLILL